MYYFVILFPIYNMKINPAVSARSTRELLDIIEVPENWQTDVVESAKQELAQRGVSNETQELRRKSHSKFKERVDRIKARSSYTTIEKLLIVLFGPLLLFIFFDFTLLFGEEGYKKKNKQRILLLLLSILFWVTVLSIIFN